MKTVEVLESIREEAFNDELKKIAASPSEVASSSLGTPASVIPGALGYAAGPRLTETDIRKAERRGASNILIPFVGPYRLGRRLATQHGNKKMYDKVMKEMQEERDKE